MRNCLLLLVLVGCSDDSANPVPDLSVKVRDLSGSNTDCDITMQNCGAGKKCVAQFLSADELVGICVDDGTVDEGQPCEIDDSDPSAFLDNCKAGTICDDLYGNQALVCRKMCSTHSDCAAGSKCGDFTFTFLGLGWCAPTCTPFSSAAGNCPAGMDCGETVDDAEQPDPQLEAGFFLCKKTGTAGPWETCDSDADCGANLWCGLLTSNAQHGNCIPNCSDTVDCSMPPVDAGGGGLTASCHPLTSQPDNAGYCLAN